MAASAPGHFSWRYPTAVVSYGAVLCVLFAVAIASAATLGGISPRAISAYDLASTTGAPNVLAHENFSGANNSSIVGTSTDSGGFTWSNALDTWRVQSNRARATSSNNAYLLFNSSTSNGSVEATIYRNGNANWDTFLIFNSNGTLSESIFVDWWFIAGGSLDLYKAVSGSFTKLASVNNLYPGTVPPSATIRLESPASGQLRVYLDGVLRISYNLTAGEMTTFKNASHRYAGIGVGADSISTFDNFHLDA